MKKYLILLCIFLAILTSSSFLGVKIGEKRARPIAHISKKTNKISKDLLSKYPVTENKSFVIVISSYNNESVCEKNLFSVFDQTYLNYRVIYIDDNSTDNTYAKVSNFIKTQGQGKLISLIKNSKRRLKLANLYEAYISCNDDEIIVCLDGDDWLSHQNVLKELNNYYQNPDIWLTYGSAINHPKYEKKDGSPISDKNLLNNRIRDIPFTASMLRTFYAGLFKKIQLKDLLFQGKFLPSADDFAFMIPMIEMAPTHSLFIPEVLYVINDSNPIRESSVIESLQIQLMRYLKTKEKYKPLGVTFNPRDLRTLTMKTLSDLIILTEDNPLALSKAIKNYTSNLTPIGRVSVLYKSSNEQSLKGYEELFKLFPAVTFIKDNELSLKTLLGAASPYVALATDDFEVTDKINMSEFINNMELTSAVSFYIKHPNCNFSRVKLNESLAALTLESALKIPELHTDSFFILFQKKFILNNLPLGQSTDTLLNTLYLKNKNHDEICLFKL